MLHDCDHYATGQLRPHDYQDLTLRLFPTAWENQLYPPSNLFMLLQVLRSRIMRFNQIHSQINEMPLGRESSI